MDEENTAMKTADAQETEQEMQEDIPVIPEDWAYPKVYQPTITLGDGTKLKGMVTKLSFSNKIWLILESQGLSYGQLITLLGDPENTKVIRFASSASERTEYLGYTYMATINAEPDGKFNIAMAKPDM